MEVYFYVLSKPRALGSMESSGNWIFTIPRVWLHVLMVPDGSETSVITSACQAAGWREERDRKDF